MDDLDLLMVWLTVLCLFLFAGYTDLLTLPRHARHIRVTERADSKATMGEMFFDFSVSDILHILEQFDMNIG